MEKEAFSLKKWVSQYRRTISNAIWNDITLAFVCIILPALHKIDNIRAGEYPSQTAAEINRRIAELRPGIITEALIGFLVIALALFIPILLYRFWLEHRIDLIKMLKEYRKENKSRC
ncbi:MAG: hypothetical protein NC517_09540 [Firmicutes bacterium]|nr:hypothetical protein [Bacillota bacterium]